MGLAHVGLVVDKTFLQLVQLIVNLTNQNAALLAEIATLKAQQEEATTP